MVTFLIEVREISSIAKHYYLRSFNLNCIWLSNIFHLIFSSHAWFLFYDLQKLRHVYWSSNICPLGAGALAGNPFNIDRGELSKSLNFERYSQNSLQAVADRDFIGTFFFNAGHY